MRNCTQIAFKYLPLNDSLLGESFGLKRAGGIRRKNEHFSLASNGT